MQQSIGLFRNHPATDVVSLGAFCAVAHNLRRYYDFSTAYPFDWWVTAGGAIVKALANLDADHFYNFDKLSVPEIRNTVVHIDSGAFLHHDFSRDAPYPNGESGRIAADYHLSIPDRAARARHLFDRLNALNAPTKRVLFVRQGDPVDGLERAIEEKFSDAVWCLFYVPKFPDDPKLGWRQSMESWDASLNEAGVTLADGHKKYSVEGGMP